MGMVFRTPCQPAPLTSNVRFVKPRAMKTLPRSIRVWFTVLLFSAATVCAIWATTYDPWGRKPGEGAGGCLKWLGGCNAGCVSQYGDNYSARAQACFSSCGRGYDNCIRTPNVVRGGAGTLGQSQPPNQVGPNSSPTPRRYPIKGPPHRLGPSPTPSAILLDKSAKPTPTPKSTPKKNSHSHHSG